MPNHGSFSEDPITVWITDPDKADRNMELLADFSYIDPQGRAWLAPKSVRINGASIPRPLWSTVGSPYTDDYRRASIVHDVACSPDSKIPRKEADMMFFHACQAGAMLYKHVSYMPGSELEHRHLQSCRSIRFPLRGFYFDLTSALGLMTNCFSSGSYLTFLEKCKTYPTMHLLNN